MFDWDPVELLTRVPIVLLALTVHEFCHARFALLMGDPTAFRLGRCTLNPLKHLDPLGTICLMFAPIGWAKPVPINALNFHDHKKGILVATAAGPASNVVQAFVFALLMRAVLYFSGSREDLFGDKGDVVFEVAFAMCWLAVFINVGLAVFNCLPLYPLDGFHITCQLMRPESQQWFAGTARYGVFGIIGLVLLGRVGKIDILGRLILPPVEFLLRYVAGLS